MNEESRMGCRFNRVQARVYILRRSRHCEVVLVYSIEEKSGVLLATPPSQTGRYTRSMAR
jgi:hypothetical protein